MAKGLKLKSGQQEEEFCKYTHRVCMQNCVDEYEYCIQHILEDKATPYKQCAYMTKSGRRCFLAAPKQDRKDGFCSEHSKKTLLSRQRLARKRKPRESVDSLLEELMVVNSTTFETHNNEQRRGRMHNDSIASKALEYASSSDSESEVSLLEQSWIDNEDSDAESIHSDQDDLLKYAGAYTVEEVAQILRDKLIRLQALYIDQFKRLKHVLLSKRELYLNSCKLEKEGQAGQVSLYKRDPHRKDQYAKLLAMKHYHKKYGKEAVLHQQSTQRRIQATEGMSPQLDHQPKCVFVDEGLRCNHTVLPLSKFCQRHILHDPAQVLYRPCPFADSQCGRPVPTLFNTEFCCLHQPIPSTKEPDQPDLNPLDEKRKIEADLFLPMLKDEMDTVVCDSLDLDVSLEDPVREVNGSSHSLHHLDRPDALFSLGELQEEEEEETIPR